MKVFSSNFSNIEYDDSLKLLTQIWKIKSRKMSEKTFKLEMSELNKSINLFRPELLLINMHCFFFVLEPETQKWVNQNVIKLIFSLQVKKIAFIKSPNIDTEVSVYQTLTEDVSTDLHKEFFLDDKKALSWLFSNDFFEPY